MLDDLDALALADGLATSALLGVDTATVIFSAPDIEVFGGGPGSAISREYRIRMPTDALPTLARGSTLTIERVEYTVQEVRQIGDGLEKEAMLSE